MKIRPQGWNPNIIWVPYIITSSPEVITINFEPSKNMISKYSTKMVNTKYYKNIVNK